MPSMPRMISRCSLCDWAGADRHEGSVVTAIKSSEAQSIQNVFFRDSILKGPRSAL